jgi:tetratricopeptide (TPR) repeat protein
LHLNRITFTSMKKITFILFLWLGNYIVFAQTNAEKAMDVMMEGIKLVDENKLDEAITTFTQAQKLDAKNIDITYEIAHCYYTKGDFKTAIPYLEKIVKNPKALDHVYQLLGNSYDNEFRKQEAFATYKKGLEKYPNSGPLYTEMGVLHISKKELQKALNYFEKGIQVDPTFASNYYHASKLFCASPNKMWGLLYGEIFMNMDRNSKRTQEISKVLFDTYAKGFRIENDKIKNVNFCSDTNTVVKNKPNKKINYGKEIYELILLSSSIDKDVINIATLQQIRASFAKLYTEKYNTDYPNILFAYHQQMIEANVMEAYTYWLLNKGNEFEFKLWANENRTSFNTFLKWFGEHPLVIDETHKIHRVDY